MKANWLPLSAAVALALGSVTASAVDFHGYARSGFMIDQGHGAGSNTLNKNRVGRLGNEDDTYAEIGLTEKVYDKGGVTFKINSKIAYSSKGVNDWETMGPCGNDSQVVGYKNKNDDNFVVSKLKGDGNCTNGSIGFREMNVEATNVLGLDETLWIGKRFNMRNDIHIIDFYYWDVSGESIGMEGAKLGPGRLGVSLTRSDRNEKIGTYKDKNYIIDKDNYIEYNDYLKTRNYILDVRYTALDLGFGSLDVGVDYAFVNQNASEKDTLYRYTDGENIFDKYDESYTEIKRQRNAKNGVMFTAQLHVPVLSGFNKTVVQWGTEGWSKAMAYYGGGNFYGCEAAHGAKGGRIINWGVITPVDNFHVAHSVLWSRSINMSDEMDSVENFDVVVRPEYAWNQYHKTMLELGYSHSQTNNEDGSESIDIQKKYTISQAISAGSGFWARPELRVFATYKDYQSKRDAFSRGNTNGDASSHEMVYGAQMEAWW
ncbi:MAG: carbohydrate porin [Succinivibrionaceae bacterium]|nr:carbohydrate porin [Succinivibrionaceae bacterium]